LSGKVEAAVLVYLQAVPSSITGTPKKFIDLENSEFRMSHSSKAALAFATKHFEGKIIAAGFSPVLRESVARGATSTLSMPLCDDPQNQLSFFPRKENFACIVVGENPDWVFSGASLCGLIAAKLGLKVMTSAQFSAEPDSVILVPDSGEDPANIDIRKISGALEAPANPESVLGDSFFRKMEESKQESLTGSSKEMTSVVARRLQRITRD
jgi:hypothetical protein